MVLTPGSTSLRPNRILTITAEEGKLMAQPTGQPKLELFPESETQFFPVTPAVEITFVKDEKGQVTHLILRQGGQDTHGEEDQLKSRREH